MQGVSRGPGKVHLSDGRHGRNLSSVCVMIAGKVIQRGFSFVLVFTSGGVRDYKIKTPSSTVGEVYIKRPLYLILEQRDLFEYNNSPKWVLLY